MDYKIYFCMDGVLRVFYSEKKPLIPLQDFQLYEKMNDFKFWSTWWNHEVIFEEGTTLGSFLKCLNPWSDFLSDWTKKDVRAYMEEAKKPTIVKKHFDWIGLSFFQELTLVSEFEKDIFDENLDIAKWLNSPKNMKFNGKWDNHERYKLTGFYHNESEHYGIDSVPFNEIVNTPLVLCKNHYICIYNVYEQFFSDYEFISEKQYGVGEINQIKFLNCEKTHSFKDVVEGFFQELDYSPELRNLHNENLKEMIQQSKKEIDELLSKTDDCHILDFKIAHSQKTTHHDGCIENNIISIDSKKKINVYTRDFQNPYEEMEKHFDSVTALSKNHSLIKIGKPKENNEPEKRIFGFIIDEKNQPPETDFKTIS